MDVNDIEVFVKIQKENRGEGARVEGVGSGRM